MQRIMISRPPFEFIIERLRCHTGAPLRSPTVAVNYATLSDNLRAADSIFLTK